MDSKSSNNKDCFKSKRMSGREKPKKERCVRNHMQQGQAEENEVCFSSPNQYMGSSSSSSNRMHSYYDPPHAPAAGSGEFRDAQVMYVNNNVMYNNNHRCMSRRTGMMANYDPCYYNGYSHHGHQNNNHRLTTGMMTTDYHNGYNRENNNHWSMTGMMMEPSMYVDSPSQPPPPPIYYHHQDDPFSCLAPYEKFFSDDNVNGCIVM